MARIKKRTPVRVSGETLERVVQQIYDDINSVISSVNSFKLTGEDYEGSPGDIRVIKTQAPTGAGFDSTYEIQFKTDDGWIKVEGTKVG